MEVTIFSKSWLTRSTPTRPGLFGPCPVMAHKVCDLGLILDSWLTLEAQINTVVKACNYHGKLLRALFHFLRFPGRKTILNAAIGIGWIIVMACIWGFQLILLGSSNGSRTRQADCFWGSWKGNISRLICTPYTGSLSVLGFCSRWLVWCTRPYTGSSTLLSQSSEVLPTHPCSALQPSSPLTCTYV